MPDEASIITREGLTAWVATALDVPPDAIGENDSLVELGLSSLMMMRLPVLLKKEGVSVKLADLIRQPDVRSWLALIQSGTPLCASSQPAAKKIESEPEYGKEPFPLTDMQRAYWLGRQEVFTLGGIAAHGYLELEGHELAFDLERLEKSLNQTIASHPMLRMRLTYDGKQEVLSDVPFYQIEYRQGPDQTIACRKEMASEILPADVWPLYKICVTDDAFGKPKYLHISFDILLFDVASLSLWLEQWYDLYTGAITAVPPPDRTFEQFIAESEIFQTSAQAQADLAWWKKRIASLPEAPQLPLACQPKELTPPVILRRESFIKPEIWRAIKTCTAHSQVTPASVFAALLGEVFSRYSRSPSMTLNLTLFDRSGERALYDGVIGDFTSMLPVVVATDAKQTFSALCQSVHAGLCDVLGHTGVGSAEVLRLIAEACGCQNENPLPVVLTCVAGSGANSYLDTASRFGQIRYARNQAPQTWIDVQVVDYSGGLSVVWDYPEALFHEGMLEDMFNQSIAMIHALADIDVWDETAAQVCLPKPQPLQLEYVPGARQLLFEPFLQRVRDNPKAPAIKNCDTVLSYGELETLSAAVAAHILSTTIPGQRDLIGVALPQGWQQVAVVLGILRAGAAYLPLNVNDPQERQITILQEGQVSIVVSSAEYLARFTDFTTVVADDALRQHGDVLSPQGDAQNQPDDMQYQQSDAQCQHGDMLCQACADPFKLVISSPDNVAYVIFTSGSTGVPKGVVVSHAAALNTIIDINCRNHVLPHDVVLAVSQLNFDLSVYDIFGTLAAGACLVIPQHMRVPEPAVWVELIDSHGVTVWNSVPSFAQLILDIAQTDINRISSLRLIMLSGDWLPVDLARNLLALAARPQLVSMGGATEAAIWSVEKVVTDIAAGQRSIPYGKPLSGQMLYVMDSAMRQCPMWVPGEIYIGGVGLAEGYFNRPDLTDRSFIMHPVTGDRLYRTGDWGRYLSDGDIEFLGRQDLQVKINGMRIELGEIEAALAVCPGVKMAVTVAGNIAQSKAIAAFVVPDDECEFDEAAVRSSLKGKLPVSWLPAVIYRESSLPLTPNGKVDRNALVALATSRLTVRTATMETVPQSNAQQRIAEIWAAILDAPSPGINVSFFEAGGNSFLAMKLASRLTASLGYPVSVVSVFQYPTIANQAKYFIEAEEFSVANQHKKNGAQNLGALAARVRGRG